MPDLSIRFLYSFELTSVNNPTLVTNATGGYTQLGQAVFTQPDPFSGAKGGETTANNAFNLNGSNDVGGTLTIGGFTYTGAITTVDQPSDRDAFGFLTTSGLYFLLVTTNSVRNYGDFNGTGVNVLGSYSSNSSPQKLDALNTLLAEQPTIANDTFTVNEGEVVTGNIATNDSIVSGTRSVYSVNGTEWTSLAASTDATYTAADGYRQLALTNGTLFIKQDGTTAYRHDGSETLSDSYSYILSDSINVSAVVGTVDITVTPVNDPPATVADSLTVAEGGAVTGNVLTNDSDAEGDGLTVGTVQGTAWSALAASTDATYTAADGYRQLALTNGTLFIKQDGTTAYRHDGSETLSDSFSYTASDGTDQSVSTSVGITVTPVNDAPVAVADSLTGLEGGVVTGNVLSNDTDAENSALTVATVNGTAWSSLTISSDAIYSGAAGYHELQLTNGTLFIKQDGTTAYRHDGSETTTDSFTYTAKDGALSSTAVTATITLDPVNDAPVLNLNGVTSIGNSTRLQTIDTIQPAPVAFAEAGVTNLSDADSTSFSHLTIRIAASEIRDGISERIQVGLAPDAPVLTLDSASGMAAFTFGGIDYEARFTDETIDSVLTRTITIGLASGNPIAIGDLEALIDNLYYANIDESIDTSTRRTFELTATDDEGLDSAATALVVTLTTATPPVIDLDTGNASAVNRTVTFTEGLPAVAATDGGANLSPADPGTEYVQLGIGFNPNFFADGGDEHIVIAGADPATSIQLIQEDSATGAFSISGVDYQYRVVHVTANIHRILFTKPGEGATFTPEEAEALLDSYRYLNTSEDPDTTNRSFNLGATTVAGGANVPTRWTVQVVPVNDAPVGVDDSGLAANGGEVSGAILHNDTDVEGDSLTVASVEGVAWDSLADSTDATYPASEGYKQVTLASGMLFIQANGHYTYRHDGSASTTESYTYRVSDGTDSSADTTVTLSIMGALDMSDATDSGTSQSDEVTSNGLPTLTFTGDPGLTISLKGADGVTLLTQGTHYEVVYDEATRTYTVTLLDAQAGGTASDPFGSFSGVSATGNPAATSDGTYTIIATTAGGDSVDVGTFEIDTTPPAAPAVDPLSTSDLTPTLTGTADVPPGGKLEVTVNGATYLVSTDPDGTWSLDLGTATPISGVLGPLEDGQTYGVLATVTDAAGNATSDTTGSELVIDTGVVVGPLDMTDATDTGASQSDELTSAGNPVLTFTGEPGLTISLKGADGVTLLTQGTHYVVVYDETEQTYTVTLKDAKSGGTATDPFGTYSGASLTANPAATADGVYTLLASDAAGNSAEIGTFEIDTTPPATPTVEPLFTSDTTPTITGTAEVPTEGILRVTVSGATYVVTPDEDGSWSLDLETATPDSGTLVPLESGQSYDVTAVVLDAAGNPASDATDSELTIDAELTVGLLDMTDATDSGTDQDDELTNNGNPILTFTGEAGLTISLRGADGTTLLTRGQHFDWTYDEELGVYTVTLLDADDSDEATDPFGTYSGSALTGNPEATADGTYTILAEDLAGNSGTVGTFQIDTTPPSTGPIDITDATDTGNDDTATSNGLPVIEFTGDAGLTISLDGANDEPLIRGTHFEWSYDPGTQTYTVTLLDANVDNGTPGEPFGDYDAEEATGNEGTNTGDGIYTIRATETSGNTAVVGTFEIDTRPPVISGYDMVDTRDLGDSADDELTSHPFPALTFTADETGLGIELRGPDGNLLEEGLHYTVSNSGTSYSVVLRDSDPADSALDPFGTYSRGTETGNEARTADGVYSITAIDLGTGARSEIGTFEIDTTSPDVRVVGGSIEISDDTGFSNSDFITNAAAQTITATLTRAINTQERLLGSADGGRTWLDLSDKLAADELRWDGVTLQGSSSIRLKVVDLAGNEGIEEVQSYILDTSAPLNRVTAIDISADTGLSDRDFITSQPSQTVTARLISSLAAGEMLWASSNGGSTWSDISSSVSGRSVNWQGVVLESGISSLQFRIEDAAGNRGRIESQAYELVSAGPTASISNIDISSDTGISDADFITNTRRQTITADLTGTLGRDERIMGSLDGGQTWVDVTRFLSGETIRWSGVNLLTGTDRSIVFKIMNTSGIDGSEARQAYTLDMVKPLAGITISSISVDDGASSNDFVTSVATQTVVARLSRPVDTGEQVFASIDSGRTWTAIPQSDIVGTNITWRSVEFASGRNSLLMRVEDIAGNVGASASRLITVQNIATVTAVDANKEEGDTGEPTAFTFKVQLLSPAASDTTLTWVVASVGRDGATAADFGDGKSSRFPSGTVTIAEGQTEAIISVPVHVDEVWAPDQAFSVKIAPVRGETGIGVNGSGMAYGTIVNDDDLTGTASRDSLTGSIKAERIYGLAGDDRINGQGGDDTINGGLGRDQLTGGAGADVFEFSSITESTVARPDTITDFKPGEGDRIDLSSIDAVPGGTDDPFVFNASGLTKTAGQVTIEVESSRSYRVLGDVDGDGVADFAISVVTTSSPTPDWLIL